MPLFEFLTLTLSKHSCLMVVFILHLFSFLFSTNEREEEIVDVARLIVPMGLMAGFLHYQSTSDDDEIEEGDEEEEEESVDNEQQLEVEDNDEQAQNGSDQN